MVTTLALFGVADERQSQISVPRPRADPHNPFTGMMTTEEMLEYSKTAGWIPYIYCYRKDENNPICVIYTYGWQPKNSHFYITSCDTKMGGGTMDAWLLQAIFPSSVFEWSLASVRGGSVEND